MTGEDVSGGKILKFQKLGGGEWGEGNTEDTHLTSQLDQLCLCASGHFNRFTKFLLILSWLDKVQGPPICLAPGVSVSLRPSSDYGKEMCSYERSGAGFY